MIDTPHRPGSERRFAVMGAGALGCYFTALLTRAGHDVALIARGRHLEAIRSDGIHVEDLRASYRVEPRHVAEHPEEVGSVQAILLAVKTWQVPDAASQLRPLVGPGTRVLPLQNGIETYDELARILGADAPLMGLCRVVCALAAPGRVRHVAAEPVVAMGEARGGGLVGNASALSEALRTAGVTVEAPKDMAAALWEKLAFIAAVSGTGAVARATVGEVRASQPTRELLRKILEEVVAVGRAAGARLADDVVARSLAFVEGLAPGSTASMQRDIAEGLPSELEAIIGAVVRRGRTLGIDTPAIEFVYASLLPQERRARIAR